MGQTRIGMSMGALICAGVLVAGCAAEGEPEPTTTVTATEMVTATPDPEPLSGDEAWLEQMREDHIDGLADWWADYYGRSCDASEAACYDAFESGIDLLEAFRLDLVDDWEDNPDFVGMTYPGLVGRTVSRMESWTYACPDRSDCDETAGVTEEAVVDVLIQAINWPDES